MKLLGSYLKSYRREIFVWLLFCGIFAVVFWLYRLPLAAVLYPALLCTVIGGIFLALHFREYKQTHQLLRRLSTLPAALITELPRPSRQEDADYQAILASLQEELRRLETTAGQRYAEAVDYYTLWAHQIKTPIASMRLQLQHTDTAESRALQGELLRIEQYVEMVLAFLRLDSDSTDYVFKEQALDPIIRQTVKKFSAEFIGRKIRLAYEPIDVRIVTDEKWLSFLLEQILSNALKYTREGYVKIYRKEPKILCIEDTGIGIAQEDLPRIFEKGYTGYNGRSDKKASGIGLYLCRRVCDNLGITITAKSEIGKGTVIELDLSQYEMRKE